ncbi:hypothetical protein LFUMFP_310003 [Latilactobacillus fuchuensis]|uniref:Uncharacterized protein n=1 Tax=Latilactobacillus fuchuensis TaxID=164393 RepID=A0A2N9DWC3_9LACO|nr:hypothetical protein LFUMFP_310003 [Latilactobacillus fuchuensis]
MGNIIYPPVRLMTFVHSYLDGIHSSTLQFHFLYFSNLSIYLE